MLSRQTVARMCAALVALVLLALIAAPYLPADRFRGRVEEGLERALQRDVKIGELRFSLWGRPGFTVSEVVIADLPEISAEPFAYVGEARVGIAPATLWRGEMTFASITLTQPSVNVAQGADGAWNFEQMLRRGVGAGKRSEDALPELRVRDGRINFRSGLKKSIYYFRSADLRLAQEERGTGAWLLEFRAEPARTDSFAPRFGTVRGRGRWLPAAGRNGELEADLEMERSPLAEVASLFRAPSGGLSGFLSARTHLSGPVEALAIRGNLELSQRGDWGIFALAGDTARVPLKGLLDLPARRIHLEASPAAETASASGGSAAAPGDAAPSPAPEAEGRAETPATTAVGGFAASVDFNPEAAPGEWVARVEFAEKPVAQVVGLLRYLDDSFPDYPQLEGNLKGEVDYRSAGGLKGAVTSDRLIWLPDPAFALRSLYLSLEGERMEGRGALDLEPARGDAADGAGAEGAKPVDGTGENPLFGFAIDRQDGRMQVSLEGRELAPAHFRALERLAPITSPPPLLEGERWAASGSAVWRRAGYRDRGGWHGQLLVRGLSIPVNGFASPVVFSVAPLQLRDDTWKLSGAKAKVGDIPVKVDAALESPPAHASDHASRELALHLTFEELSLAQLQREVILQQADSRGFLSRTFSPGAPAPPAWLRNRSLLAKIYIKKVLIENSKYYDVRGDLYWDGASLDVRNITLQSRFGALQAQIRPHLEVSPPVWNWTAIGQNLPWRSGEVELREDFTATGSLDSILSRSEGRSEIAWRRMGSAEWPAGSVTRVSLRWLPGVEGPTICAQCVEFRSGSEIYLGSCERGNGTTYRCLLEDPRTGQEHEINLPISLFGTGAN
ncbi:MAG: hypothetical protein IT169_08745 [Bryobacterales bacterium]|nr:hypothetical protein [Bryobacterales bacterium]